jgi:ribosome-binding protein aMBF1 (putative translation factor)
MLCDVPKCKNTVSDTDPCVVIIDGHEFTVCDDCGNIMNHITAKFEERLDNDYESL